MHSPGAFPLAAGNSIASIYLQLSCAKAISLAAEAFRSDVEEVTGRQPTILRGDAPPEQEHVLLVGEYGNAPLLDSLARENRLPRFE